MSTVWVRPERKMSPVVYGVVWTGGLWTWHTHCGRGSAKLWKKRYPSDLGPDPKIKLQLKSFFQVGERYQNSQGINTGDT